MKIGIMSTLLQSVGYCFRSMSSTIKKSLSVRSTRCVVLPSSRLSGQAAEIVSKPIALRFENVVRYFAASIEILGLLKLYF